MNSQRTPSTSPSRVNYGVYCIVIWREKIVVRLYGFGDVMRSKTPCSGQFVISKHRVIAVSIHCRIDVNTKAIYILMLAKHFLEMQIQFMEFYNTLTYFHSHNFPLAGAKPNSLWRHHNSKYDVPWQQMRTVCRVVSTVAGELMRQEARLRGPHIK